MLKDWTLEIYAPDRRCKTGERFLGKYDYTARDEQWMREEVQELKHGLYKGCRIELRETWVTRKNLMTGTEFQERYDTPWTCSPASELYWSM